jgi:hypothetical protein
MMAYYFLQRDWYNPLEKFNDDDCWKNIFNEYERHNVEMIMKYEKLR